MADSYRGVIGAIPYAIRHTDSWTMRVYGVVGVVAALFVALVVTLALVVWMGETAEMESSIFLFTRSLYVVAGLAAVGPLLAPVLLVARRHRRDRSVPDGYDRTLALTGFGFLVSLYLAVIISAPVDLREPSDFVIVTFLYALPPFVGLLLPILAAVVMVVVYRRLTRQEGS